MATISLWRDIGRKKRVERMIRREMCKKWRVTETREKNVVVGEWPKVLKKMQVCLYTCKHKCSEMQIEAVADDRRESLVN